MRVLGIESPRPLLAIPHLLNQESAASYQGYLLALMAVVADTRALPPGVRLSHRQPCDRSALSAEHYWEPGNSVDHDRMLRSLTGEGFSARDLADECNESVEEASARAEELMRVGGGAPLSRTRAAEPRRHIRIVHGAELLADSSDGEEAMCDRFEAWVTLHYAAPA